MAAWIKKEILRTALLRILNRLAPSKFSYSHKNDYYVAVVKGREDNEDILFKSIDGNTIKGLKWNGERFEVEIEISLADAVGRTFEVSRFYGWKQWTYTSLGDFWRNEISLSAWRHWIYDFFLQKLYNSKTKFQLDRIGLLQKLVAIHIESANLSGNNILVSPTNYSATSLLLRIYGNRFFAHPAYKREFARFKMIIDSLIHTDDLVKEEHGNFRLSKKALFTIASFEETERRHYDSVIQNRRIWWLTVVLAVAAVTQTILVIVK